MLNKITPIEKATIESWIETYGETVENGVQLDSERREDFDTIFAEWACCNSLLSKILDDKLILSKPIEVTLSDKVMEHRAERQLVRHEFITDIFWHHLVYLNAYPKDFNIPSNLSNKFRLLVSTKHLATNEWSGDTFTIPILDGKTIRVEKGTKILRVLGKLAKAFNLPKFEDFRILHSQIMNDKTVRGELCLSIHPLDFLTMSDNTLNWSSCMRFSALKAGRSPLLNAGGCYRVGTVEMMNSPYIIEAYVRDRSPMVMPNGQEWSNKKWRTLIFVDRSLITSIKSYPYQSSVLSRAAVDWVRELAQKNVGWTYEGETATAWKYFGDDDSSQTFPNAANAHVMISMETDRMYNDFGECTYHYGFIRDGLTPKSICELEYNYSGARTCLWCGKVETDCSDMDELRDDFVICKDCSDAVECYGCNAHLSILAAVPLTSRHHQVYCPHCLERETTIDCITQSRRENYDYSCIFLLTEEQKHTLTNTPESFYWSEEELPSIKTNAFDFSPAHSALSKYFTITMPRYETYGDWFCHRTPRYVLGSDCTPEGLALFKKTVED